MNNIRAFYSIIQYVPDGGRAEGANAGVVLFVPSTKRIVVRTSPTLARVRQFFAPGKQQLRRIELGLESLKHRLAMEQDEFESEEEFAKFVAARADAVRLTKPRLALVTEPMNDLNVLYDELVSDPELLKRPRSKQVTLPARVAEIFGRLEAERKIQRPGSIKVPTIHRHFDVSLVYQNGLTNYVKAESLAKRAYAEGMLPKLGFNGQLIHQHPIDEQRGKLIVLSADPAAEADIEEEFRRTLKEFHVRFVPYQEAEAFAQEVEETAH